MKRAISVVCFSALLAAGIGANAGEVAVPVVRKIDAGVAKAWMDRRVSLSDAKTAYSFSPFACVRCHSAGPGAMAPVFYGNRDYAKDQWKPSGTGVTLKNWKWEDATEHDESFYKVGATQADMLNRSW